MQSHLNVLALPWRLLAASVNLLTIVLEVISKTSKKSRPPSCQSHSYKNILHFTLHGEEVWNLWYIGSGRIKPLLCVFKDITILFKILSLNFSLFGSQKFRIKLVRTTEYILQSSKRYFQRMAEVTNCLFFLYHWKITGSNHSCGQ